MYEQNSWTERHYSHFMASTLSPAISSQPVPHLGRCSSRSSTACPSPLPQPTNQFGRQTGSESDADRNEKSFVNGVCKQYHGIETLLSALLNASGSGVHVFLTRLRRPGVYKTDDRLLCRCCKLGDLLGTNKINGCKRNAKVDDR